MLEILDVNLTIVNQVFHKLVSSIMYKVLSTEGDAFRWSWQRGEGASVSWRRGR